MVISFPSLQISLSALVCDLEKQHARGLPGFLWKELGLNAKSNWKCSSAGCCCAQSVGLSSEVEDELCCRHGVSMKSTWGEKMLHRSYRSPWHMESPGAVWDQPGKHWGQGCVVLTLLGWWSKGKSMGWACKCYFSVKFVPQHCKTTRFGQGAAGLSSQQQPAT